MGEFSSYIASIIVSTTPLTQWNVSKLSNGNHSIKNVKANMPYAVVGNRALAGATIEGRSCLSFCSYFFCSLDMRL
jgi:hypothetical protein